MACSSVAIGRGGLVVSRGPSKGCLSREEPCARYPAPGTRASPIIIPKGALGPRHPVRSWAMLHLGTLVTLRNTDSSETFGLYPRFVASRDWSHLETRGTFEPRGIPGPVGVLWCLGTRGISRLLWSTGGGAAGATSSSWASQRDPRITRGIHPSAARSSERVCQEDPKSRLCRGCAFRPTRL
ncbi:hypothetical protein M885DRAFT_264949 [Pelagophyceae sp. CCMP2097]|nr:hypothetical protein M885DRAFT_264949 [Pelagophyceae sp. CCMP2097]